MNASNQSDCPTNETGTEPMALIEMHFSLAVGYIALAILLTVVGLPGNASLIYLIAKEKNMNDHAKFFVLNNAVADFCVAGIANPVCIAGAFLGINHFYRSYWFCSFIASLCLTACVCVFLNFSNLTINRWLFICHNRHYHDIYNKTTIIVTCLLCWVLGFTAELPNFLGWGGHYFDEKSHQCIWDRTASRSYTLFVAIGLLTTPFVLNGICTFSILRSLWNAKREIGLFQTTNRNTFRQSMHSAKTLVGVYLTFLVCWTPYVVVLVLDDSDTFSMETHLFVTLLAHSHSSTTFFVYLAFNRRFQQAFKRLVHGHRTNQVAPSTTNAKAPTVHTVSKVTSSGISNPGIKEAATASSNLNDNKVRRLKLNVNH